MPIYKPSKPYNQDINDLVVDDELSKGKALPIGTVRNWSGTSFVKEADGWKPVAHSKNEKPVEDAPKTKSKTDTPERINHHEKAALKEYQSGMYGSALGGYANIQSQLRSGKPQFGKYTPQEVKLVGDVASHVSSAIKRHPIEKPMTVYRGVKVNKDSPGSEHLDSLKVGDTFSDKGFTSTTTSKEVANKFTEKLNRSDKPILMEISLKAGDHALSMDQYHKSDEAEILLDREVTFKVVSVSESKGVKKLKVEITESKVDSESSNTEHNRPLYDNHQKIKSVKVIPFTSFKDAKDYHDTLTKEIIDHKDFSSWDKIPESTLKLSQLSTTQDQVAKPDGRNSESAILVAKKDGKYIIVNGNHRAEQSFQDGKSEIKVKIFDLDTQTETTKNKVNASDKESALDQLLGPVKDKDFDQFKSDFDKALASAKTESVDQSNSKEYFRSHKEDMNSNTQSPLNRKGDSARGKDVKDPSIAIKIKDKTYILDGQHRLNQAVKDGSKAKVVVLDGSFLSKYGIDESHFKGKVHN